MDLSHTLRLFLFSSTLVEKICSVPRGGIELRLPVTSQACSFNVIWLTVQASDNAQFFAIRALICLYLTIIPRARMGYQSIACDAEGRMGH